MNLAFPIDQELSRLQKSCVAAIEGQTIGAIMKTDPNAPALLNMEIKFCAATYCAAPNTEKDVIAESARFVASQFSHLNISEIREAFRLAAAGSIEADLTAYYGMFSVNILGRVLIAYDDHRTQVYREIRARKQAEQDARENEQRAEILKERFGTISEQFDDLKRFNNRYCRWQDLPEWFCRRVIDEDLLGMDSKEKAAHWIAAKRWAANQLGMWRLDAANSIEDRKRFNAANAVLTSDPDAFPDELQKEAKEAYAKMLVFSKIAEYGTAKES